MWLKDRDCHLDGYKELVNVCVKQRFTCKYRKQEKKSAARSIQKQRFCRLELNVEKERSYFHFLKSCLNEWFS